jgi:phage terminase large subunit-like protein
LARFKAVYGGTTIGRQELGGELLDEAEGALWKRADIEACRVRSAPELVRIVVAIDPSVTSTATSDECGIVAAGLGVDGHGYVLKDSSCRLPPAQWAHRAISVFDAISADKIIAEVNNGGDLVELVLRTERQNIPFKKVSASRGKVTRAEPVAALYEQKKIHHVGGFEELEDEMCNFVPGELSKSPNRADALVWAFTELMLKPEVQGMFF